VRILQRRCGARFHRHGSGAVLRAGLLPTAEAK
jgi:hypothetical protein